MDESRDHQCNPLIDWLMRIYYWINRQTQTGDCDQPGKSMKLKPGANLPTCGEIGELNAHRLNKIIMV